MQGTSIDLFQGFLIGTLLILTFVVAIILFVVVYNLRLSRQQREMLEKEAQYQRDLLFATIESQEKERERIARDLHDEIGAMLSTINLGVARYQKKVDPGSPGASFSRSTKELVDATSDQVRRISRELLPAGLSRFGLVATVKDLFKLVGQQGGIEASADDLPAGVELTPEQQLGLYRIVQESTNNTLKYAEASRIRLAFSRIEAGLEMTYEDNGIGFYLPEAQGRKSLGLKNIESRAGMLGGEAKIVTELGGGVTIRVVIGRDRANQIS